MYGQKLLDIVQGPGEVLFLPQGLTHAILNLEDNVAYTENYLYIGGLPGKRKSIRTLYCYNLFVRVYIRPIFTEGIVLFEQMHAVLFD